MKLNFNGILISLNSLHVCGGVLKLPVFRPGLNSVSLFDAYVCIEIFFSYVMQLGQTD